MTTSIEYNIYSSPHNEEICFQVVLCNKTIYRIGCANNLQNRF